MEYLVQGCLCALAIVQVYSLCSSRQFTAVHDEYYTGTLLYSYNKTALSVKQCERMCRQLIQCNGFNMKWVDVQGHSGHCQFFTLDDTVTLIADGTMSLYTETGRTK